MTKLPERVNAASKKQTPSDRACTRYRRAVYELVEPHSNVLEADLKLSTLVMLIAALLVQVTSTLIAIQFTPYLF